MPRRDPDRAPEFQEAARRLSRRGFLKASGALLVVAATGEATGAGPTDAPTVPPQATPGPPLAPATPVLSQYPGTPSPEVPFAPAEPPSPGTLRFFTPHEARTVEAISARLIPGDADDPGAREAGAVNYIDYALSNGHGFNEPIYRLPPFAQPFEGDAPPEGEAFGAVWVPADQLERYGYQSVLTPREMFRVGLAALDRYAQGAFGGTFVALSGEDQDRALEALEDGEAEGFTEPSAEDVFELLLEYTLQGTFSDPQYGGNRDLVGWQLLNYPGAQRAYTPTDMLTEGHSLRIQPMAELDHVHPGQDANPHVVLPVFGSDLEHPRPHQSHSPEPTQGGE